MPPTRALKVPAGHGLHAAVPFAKVPTGQEAAVKGQDAAPATLKAFAAQAAHKAADVPPVAPRKRPAGQAVQEALPVCAAKEPAGHDTQAVLPEAG